MDNLPPDDLVDEPEIDDEEAEEIDVASVIDDLRAIHTELDYELLFVEIAEDYLLEATEEEYPERIDHLFDLAEDIEAIHAMAIEEFHRQFAAIHPAVTLAQIAEAVIPIGMIVHSDGASEFWFDYFAQLQPEQAIEEVLDFPSHKILLELDPEGEFLSLDFEEAETRH